MTTADEENQIAEILDERSVEHTEWITPKMRRRQALGRCAFCWRRWDYTYKATTTSGGVTRTAYITTCSRHGSEGIKLVSERVAV